MARLLSKDLERIKLVKEIISLRTAVRLSSFLRLTWLFATSRFYSFLFFDSFNYQNPSFPNKDGTIEFRISRIVKYLQLLPFNARLLL